MTNPLLGTWRLQSFTTQYRDTGEEVEPYGTEPSGYLNYGPDHRMYVIVAAGGRKAPIAAAPTSAETIELFNSMAAYAGTYTIDGDEVSHRVDVSWIEAWTGTVQVRRFRIEGNALHIQSPAAPDPLDGRLSSSRLVWSKVREPSDHG